jgi:predicted RNA-binding protein with PIN domain
VNLFRLQEDRIESDLKILTGFMKTIIIDGNNLIHKVPEYKKRFQENKEATALSLIESVKSKIKRTKIVFVFDGFGDIKMNNVIFSGKLTADEVIRKAIEDNYEKKQFTVISSDAGITGLARICGCEVKTSEEFWNEIKPKTVQNNKNINQLLYLDENEKPERITKKELNEFKKYFT